MSEVALLRHSVALNALAVLRTLASHPLEHFRIGKVPDKLVDPGSPIELVIVRAVEDTERRIGVNPRGCRRLCHVPGFVILTALARLLCRWEYGLPINLLRCNSFSSRTPRELTLRSAGTPTAPPRIPRGCLPSCHCIEKAS
jgi:hypothetical protein